MGTVPPTSAWPDLRSKHLGDLGGSELTKDTGYRFVGHEIMGYHGKMIVDHQILFLLGGFFNDLPL